MVTWQLYLFSELLWNYEFIITKITFTKNQTFFMLRKFGAIQYVEIGLTLITVTLSAKSGKVGFFFMVNRTSVVPCRYIASLETSNFY